MIGCRIVADLLYFLSMFSGNDSPTVNSPSSQEILWDREKAARAIIHRVTILINYCKGRCQSTVLQHNAQMLEKSMQDLLNPLPPDMVTGFTDLQGEEFIMHPELVQSANALELAAEAKYTSRHRHPSLASLVLKLRELKQQGA
jgi:hypothetical protein